MESYKLDKVLAEDTNYYTESDTCLIIQQVGTDDSTRAVLSVEGVPVLETVADIANLNSLAAHPLDLFDLGTLYIVIPPDKVFSFTGSGTDSLRIKGYILRLAPGETVPAGHLARYTEQGKKYWDYYQEAEGSDASLAIGAVVTVLSQTCPTGEKWLFNSYYMAQLLNQAGGNTAAIDYGLASRISLQDKPFDNLITAKLILGIDQYATPYPPDGTTGGKVFSFKDRPIEFKPGQVLKVEAVNASTAAIDFDATSKALIVGVKEYL